MLSSDWSFLFKNVPQLHSMFLSYFPAFLCPTSVWVKINCSKQSQHPPIILSQPVCGGGGNAIAIHQPSHQDEPGGAVIKGVLAVAEDVWALLCSSVWTSVINKCLVINQVGHFTLPLVCQLGDLWVSGGEGGRGCAVSQALIDTTVEDWGAEGVWGLGSWAKIEERQQ